MRTLFFLLTFSFVLLFISCSNSEYLGGKKREIIFKNNISDSLYTATLGRKVEKINLKHRKLSDVIKYIEPKLFEKYGKDKIKSQLPYEFDFINEFWLIKGSLRKNTKGEVFLVIMDSVTGKIETMTFSELNY